MEYKVKTVKTLIADNGKEFGVGTDIGFTVYNKVTNYHDRFIGRITEIRDEVIIIDNVELNKGNIDGKMVIALDNIEKNSCNYVYVD